MSCCKGFQKLTQIEFLQTLKSKNDNFTLLDAVKDLIKGEIADEDTITTREKICMECEKHFKPTDTCLECGCFLIAKRRFKNATCVNGKW